VSDPGRSPRAAVSGRLPLVVGVTGHRDLREQDRDALEAWVRQLLVEIRERYPHTPVVVLSPLAEGADRLVARVALALCLQLVVPLPVPRALYETDFETAASKTEFERLLGRAREWFELPLADGNTEERIREPGGPRNRQYAAVGEYIARQSHILIALWDGAPPDPELEGGTAHIVDFRLEALGRRGRSAAGPPDPLDRGPVYHIVAPRVKHPNPNHALTAGWLFPEGFGSDAAAEAAYHAAYAGLERLNARSADPPTNRDSPV